MLTKQYETVFILTPVLSEQETKDAVAKYRDFITSNGGTIVNEENWGMRKLAYPIQKKKNGFYNLFEFTAPTDFVQKWELNFKRDENVMRFLTVALDKHAIAYNERRRQKNSQTKKEEVEA